MLFVLGCRLPTPAALPTYIGGFVVRFPAEGDHVRDRYILLRSRKLLQPSPAVKAVLWAHNLGGQELGGLRCHQRFVCGVQQAPQLRSETWEWRASV